MSKVLLKRLSTPSISAPWRAFQSGFLGLSSSDWCEAYSRTAPIRGLPFFILLGVTNLSLVYAIKFAQDTPQRHAEGFQFQLYILDIWHLEPLFSGAD
ncbi:Pectin lyase A [Gossypium arboreum]|uniref:Pectin lyase A n=1 Tax=Gossypium arboreum TaxID=29729 RepID=A0A0B0MN44_GOSAR|nr:Pectin lyase A [Gossypium arboreum]